MMDFMKQALMNDKTGEPSSSRVNSTVLVWCSVAGFIFATLIIAHSYFVYGVIPTGESILVYYLGGSTGGALAGAGLYAVGKYADRDLPMQPSEVVEDSLNENNDEH